MLGPTRLYSLIEFEQAWSGGLVLLATSLAASNAAPWATFEVAGVNAEQVRTNTPASVRAGWDVGLALADHDFLSALAGC